MLMCAVCPSAMYMLRKRLHTLNNIRFIGVLYSNISNTVKFTYSMKRTAYILYSVISMRETSCRILLNLSKTDLSTQY